MESNPIKWLGSAIEHSQTLTKKMGQSNVRLGSIEFNWVWLSSPNRFDIASVDVFLAVYQIGLHSLKMVVVREYENTSARVLLCTRYSDFYIKHKATRYERAEGLSTSIKNPKETISLVEKLTGFFYAYLFCGLSGALNFWIKFLLF